MLAIERYNQILQILGEQGHASTAELCKRLGASPATVRSDLAKLEKKGLLLKAHGGAILPGAAGAAGVIYPGAAGAMLSGANGATYTGAAGAMIPGANGATYTGAAGATYPGASGATYPGAAGATYPGTSGGAYPGAPDALPGEALAALSPLTTFSPQSAYSFKTRESQNAAEKQAISLRALEHIEDGQCIILDASSTALTLARRLTRMKKLTVVTNGIYTMLALKDIPGITVILTGGIVTNGSGSIEGLLGSSMLKGINADIGFFSCHGFTLEEGLTDFNLYEIELKKQMLSRCHFKVALVDSSKFEKTSTASFCPCSEIDLLLTDDKGDEGILERYRKGGVNLEVCSCS